MQGPTLLLEKVAPTGLKPIKAQLLKWIGNKQRFAFEITKYFPPNFGTYFEPFLGSGAVLATLMPKKGVGSDSFTPLMEIWKTLKDSPQVLKDWYRDRWEFFTQGDKKERYAMIRQQYNAHPNGADLLFLCRSCYGGVVRFRKSDGHISTPCGIHSPISPESFSRRVDQWSRRIQGASFHLMNYEEALKMAKPGDLVYCDPPYRHTQSILYGAQEFNFNKLLTLIDKNKSRGIYTALSIDGTKQSGKKLCDLQIPKGLFPREIFVHCGRSMLKRFQMTGQSLGGEEISDRLLLTY